MKILTVLKRYNKIFAIIITGTIIAIYLVITLSGNYLNERLYHDVHAKQPMNNIFAVPEKKDDDNKKDDNENNTKEDFSYEFTEDSSIGDYIYMINQFPMKDEVGRKLEGKYKTYNFSLKFNSASAGTQYTITLEKMPESNLFSNWVKVYLENEGVEVANCIRNTGRVKTFNEFSKYNDKEEEIVLYKGTITSEEAQRGYKNYTLRMWVSEDVNVVNEDYEERSIVARVNVYANGKN